MRERTSLDEQISGIRKLERDLDDATTLIELGEMEDDAATIAEGEQAVRAAAAEGARRQVETLLSGEADANDTYLEIHPGAGGTESQDWAEMLLRMYSRWAEKRKFKVELLESQAGEAAGIKSATLLVKGHNAYGWLKTESGVHRLVRISPFDANARRQTSFASAWVYPVIDDKIVVDVKESDCRIDTSVRQGPAASTSTRPTRRCASRTFPPASWSAASRSAPSTRTAPRPGTCCARASTRWS